jgi:CBS domain-containing protein
MMLVRHVMAGAPVTASPDMNAYDAASLMQTHDIGVLPIADGDRLIGLVTDRDLVLRVLAARRDPSDVRLGDIATTKGVETVTPDTELADARALMADKRIRRLPVVKDGSLVGMLSLGDVALASASMRGVGETLAEISVSPATQQTNAGPDVGTPARVRDREEASSRSR